MIRFQFCYSWEAFIALIITKTRWQHSSKLIFCVLTKCMIMRMTRESSKSLNRLTKVTRSKSFSSECRIATSIYKNLMTIFQKKADRKMFSHKKNLRDFCLKSKNKTYVWISFKMYFRQKNSKMKNRSFSRTMSVDKSSKRLIKRTKLCAKKPLTRKNVMFLIKNVLFANCMIWSKRFKKTEAALTINLRRRTTV